MKAYSWDLRVRVMADVDAGLKSVDVAKKYSVSTDWIRKLKRMRRTFGSFAARRSGYAPGSRLDPVLPQLVEIMDAKPDATLPEICAQVEEKLGVPTSPSAVGRTLREIGYTRKKSISSPANA